MLTIIFWQLNHANNLTNHRKRVGTNHGPIIASRLGAQTDTEDVTCKILALMIDKGMWPKQTQEFKYHEHEL